MKRRAVAVNIAYTLGMTFVLLWLLTGFSAGRSAAAAAELHVCPAGCDHASVQAAVDAANPGDIIKVAAGRYTGVSHRGGITQVVYISKSVTLQGGYTTTNWTTPYPVTQPTTLDAQAQGGVMSIVGYVSPTVEGLHVTGGAQYYDEHGEPWGSGIWVLSATATLSGNWVFSNTAPCCTGGGLALGYSPSILRGNWVYSNSASSGGGMGLWQSDATIIGNRVSSNTSYSGGGLYIKSSTVTLAENIVVANKASSSGGGLYLRGSAATLNGNMILSNSATSGGGGLYLSGGAAALNGNMILSNSATSELSIGGGLLLGVRGATLNGNVIARNTAGMGGGMSVGGGPVTLTGNTIVSNAAVSTWGGISIGGGGLRFLSSDSILVNNVVADNQASIPGSGVYAAGSSLRLLHNTIARNRGGGGSGVYVGSYISPTASVVTLTNTILVSHTVGITVESGNTATLAATLWGAGAWANLADWGGAGTVITGAINVRGEPDFVDPARGDYHIGENSAAIDAGVASGITTDIDGEPRPLGAGFEIGADELKPSVPVVGATIDIKPGSFPNSINPKSRGKIPVAILSTHDFDAPGQVDRTSLRFGRMGDEESLLFCNESAEDVNADGRMDLVCHFRTQWTGFQAGDAEGILKGKTVDGVRLEGSDSVRIVP